MYVKGLNLPLAPAAAAPLAQAIVGGATIVSLTCLGIDIRPLLAFGSVSSLVVGFAAQNTIR